MLIKNDNIKKLIFSIILIFLIYINNFSFFFYSNSPLVSIIIHVRNSFNYTFKCIDSILKTTPSSSYEIIIINKTLNNDIKLLEKSYNKKGANIILYQNKETNNFLKNYNQAIKISKGEYITFLRDNTKVYENWLTSLLKPFENDEKIGIIGSKVIYSNGTLKEAGGIMWNNGEYSNFGRGKFSDNPEYNYIKEVDFVSGISFIIKKSILEKIGGFDEQFIHLDYKYIDFSFSLRKYGYKVIYQPESLVKQYNEILKGVNIISDIKKINKHLFIKKWKEELIYQSNQNNNTFLARDRSFNKNRIFVIDRYIPKYDRNAGSRCCFMYLNIFKEIGLQVTFLGDDLKKIEPYTSILQQKGIEVLYGNYFKNEKLEIWLKKNLRYFKYIYLQRPEITIKYIDLIKKYSSEKVIYFAHDLHYVRLSREYEITGDIKKLIQSRDIKRIEMKIFNKVDIIHIVGNYEYKILKKEFKNKTIRNIPLYFYEKPLKNIEKNFSKRKDLVFVGGFKHSPNIDGILWFSKEIFPKVIDKFPNLILHIVSPKIPHEIKKLESKNIKLEGFLSDKELHLMYQKCRIAIAPLRFGAGVKGKVLEAAYNQIPMITTTIGGEGIEDSKGAFIMEDNPEKMADIISQIYEDYSKLKQMSDSGRALIEKYYSKNRAIEIILKDIKL